MNPNEMTPKQIIEAMGLRPDDVEAVSIRPNGSGEIILTDRDADNITWHSPADFSKLVEARRVKPWEAESSDENTAVNLLLQYRTEGTLGLVWGNYTIHNNLTNILARIGFREVMADIKAKQA